jgi:hypothetical protein
VQLASDADPFFPDLLPGTFGFGGALTFGLLGQPGQVVPPCRNAVADEPRRHQRHEALHGHQGRQRPSPARERRVQQRRAQPRRGHRGGRDRPASGHPRGHEENPEPEHDNERHGCVSQDHGQPGARGKRDAGRPLALVGGPGQVPPGRLPRQIIPSHGNDRNAPSHGARQPRE